MAYYTGTATSLADLRTKFIEAATANGWTLNGAILSNGNCHARLNVNANALELRGRINAGSDNTAAVETTPVRIYESQTNAYNYPVSYEIHAYQNPAEIFMVVNFAVEYFHFMAMGQSSIDVSPGSGMWVTASKGASETTNACPATTNIPNGYLGFHANTPFFSKGWQNSANSYQNAAINSFIHTGLESTGWKSEADSSNNTQAVGAISFQSHLLTPSPMPLNSANILAPVKVIQKRGANDRISIVADLKNARFIRIDNLKAKEIITLGPDKWIAYPLYRKNIDVRNGDQASTSTHSGTFGIAIRYTGT